MALSGIFKALSGNSKALSAFVSYVMHGAKKALSKTSGLLCSVREKRLNTCQKRLKSRI